MTLQEKQSIFAKHVSQLIIYIDNSGRTCTLGEAYRTPEQAELYAKEGKGIVNSLHCKKLAIDIQLFDVNGKFLLEKSDYEQAGKYWESLHPLNRWGGEFKRCDYVHFEMQDL